MNSSFIDVNRQTQKVLAHLNGLEKIYRHVKFEEELGVGPTKTDLDALTDSVEALVNDSQFLQEKIEYYKNSL